MQGLPLSKGLDETLLKYSLTKRQFNVEEFLLDNDFLKQSSTIEEYTMKCAITLAVLEKLAEKHEELVTLSRVRNRTARFSFYWTDIRNTHDRLFPNSDHPPVPSINFIQIYKNMNSPQNREKMDIKNKMRFGEEAGAAKYLPENVKLELYKSRNLILKFLQNNKKRGGVTLGEISRQLAVKMGSPYDSMSLTQLLKRMIDRGYITREKRGIFTYNITEIGEDYLGRKIKKVSNEIVAPTDISDDPKTKNQTSEFIKTINRRLGARLSTDIKAILPFNYGNKSYVVFKRIYRTNKKTSYLNVSDQFRRIQLGDLIMYVNLREFSFPIIGFIRENKPVDQYESKRTVTIESNKNVTWIITLRSSDICEGYAFLYKLKILR